MSENTFDSNNLRTSKKAQELDQQIQEELGIDVRKYQNEEVIESFAELIVFPSYVINWVIRPLLVSIGIFILGFFVLDLVHVEYFFYGTLGLLLFLATGIVAGLIFLIRKMKADIWGIAEYSFEIMQAAVADLKQVRNKLTDENRKQVYGLLFKGIIHVITIPVLSKLIGEKVPLIGGVIAGMIKRIFTYLANKIEFDDHFVEQELNRADGDQEETNTYSATLSATTSGLGTVVNFAFLAAQFPLKIIFFILLFLLLLFLYIIH